MKRPPAPRKPKLRHRYEQTDVQCLLRRIGPDGVTYYGRVKRHGKVYLRKLGDEFQAAKKSLRTWLNGVDVKAEAAAAADEQTKDFTTWGHFAKAYLDATELDVSLAPKSKTYRKECVHRIKVTWKTLANGDDLTQRKMSTITQDNCAKWAAGITGYHHTTYNNTVGVFKRILQDAVEAGHLLVNPAGKLKRVGKKRLALARHGEAGEPLTKEERKALDLPAENHRWYPSPEEFAAIVKKMRSYHSAKPKRAADFAELLCYSGCRLSEANRLTWADVDWTKNKLRVDGSKGRATDEEAIRFVPIMASLAGLLRRLEKRDHQPQDKIALVSECRGTMQHACEDLSMPRRLDHHDLRHHSEHRIIPSDA